MSSDGCYQHQVVIIGELSKNHLGITWLLIDSLKGELKVFKKLYKFNQNLLMLIFN